MSRIDETLRLLKDRSKPAKEKHRQDVAYVQAHHQELAKVLTEFTKEFGRINYRVSIRLCTK